MQEHSSIALGLLGRHQAANAAVAIAAIEALIDNGWKIPAAAIRRGLEKIVWPVRVEVVSRRPTVVLDAAHNAASIAALVETLAESFWHSDGCLFSLRPRRKTSAEC